MLGANPPLLFGPLRCTMQLKGSKMGTAHVLLWCCNSGHYVSQTKAWEKVSNSFIVQSHTCVKARDNWECKQLAPLPSSEIPLVSDTWMAARWEAAFPKASQYHLSHDGYQWIVKLTATGKLYVPHSSLDSSSHDSEKFVRCEKAINGHFQGHSTCLWCLRQVRLYKKGYIKSKDITRHSAALSWNTEWEKACLKKFP